MAQPCDNQATTQDIHIHDTSQHSPHQNIPTRTINMDEIPEELLDQIIAHVATSQTPLLTPPDTATLYALCRTSWKYYRIAKPYLYAHVHSYSGSMGRQFFDTISKDPVLANRVKHLAVQHTAEGCFRPVKSSIDQEELYGTVTDTCSVLLLQTLRVLDGLEALDLSRFAVRLNSRTEWLDAVIKLMEEPVSVLAHEISVPLGPLERQEQTGVSLTTAAPALSSSPTTKLIGEPPSPRLNRPPIFSKLRHLSVHLSAIPVYELLPFFGLPQLRSLEVDIRRYGSPARIRAINTDKSYPISSLSVIGFSHQKLDQVGWLAARCSDLHDLLVTTKITDSKFIGRLFARHIRSGSLKTIRVAIVGLWHYEVEMKETQESDTELGDELYSALVYASSTVGVVEGRVELPTECYSVRSVTIRELTEAEKKAYDVELPRRP